MKLMARQRTCKYCGEDFTPAHNHPGLITVCLEDECQERMRADGVVEPELKTACVAWSGKHTVEITIVDDPFMSARFNASQKRHGAGVAMGLTGGYTGPKVKEAGKEYEVPEHRHGFQAGDLWFNSLGESHAKKR